MTDQPRRSIPYSPFSVFAAFAVGCAAGAAVVLFLLPDERLPATIKFGLAGASVAFAFARPVIVGLGVYAGSTLCVLAFQDPEYPPQIAVGLALIGLLPALAGAVATFALFYSRRAPLRRERR